MSVAWQILPDAATPDVPSVVITHAGPSGGPRSAVLFSGRGVVLPFRRDKKSDFANASGVALVQANVALVLGTKSAFGAHLGEVPWRTEFGSIAYLLRFRNNSVVLGEQAKLFVARALGRWEPRCQIADVVVDQPQDRPRLMIIRISYSVVLGGGGAQVVVPGLVTSVALG